MEQSTKLAGVVKLTILLFLAIIAGTMQAQNTATCNITITLGSANTLPNLCIGGAGVVVTGGTMPYTYSWSNGKTTPAVSGLCKGCYTLAVTDAQACTRSSVVCIQDSSFGNNCSSLMLSAAGVNSTNNTNCNGLVSAMAMGGTAPYTYAWSNGVITQIATGVCAGCYTVTATDANGCTKTAKVCITGGNANCNSMVINTNGVNPSSNNACDGSVSVVTWGGTAPYTYSWSNGAATSSASGLCSGCYFVKVTDANGCSRNSAVCIKGPGSCGLTAIVSGTNPGNLCNGNAVATVNGGTTPYTYKWSTGATTPALSNLCKGCYKVTVKDAKGCKAKGIVCLFGGSEPPPFGEQNELEEELMSVEPGENDVEDVVDMYPNPSSGRVMLVYATPATGKVGISVKDIVGREVYSELKEAYQGRNAYNLDLSGIGKGIYLLKVINPVSGKQSTRKLLME